MEQIKIDLVPNGVMSVAHASQFDVGRSMKFLLTDEGVTYTLAGTEVITMKLRKPDGTDDTISLVNTSSSYVEWTTVDGDLDLSGVYLAEITITSGDDVLGTANFLLKVEPDPYNGKNIRIVTVGPADICTFETTLPEPYPSVLVNVQASGGNGTPDSPIPINGYTEANITRCGVNLWDEEWEAGGINGTTGLNNNENNCIRSKNYIRVYPNQTLYFKAPTTWTAHSIRGRCYKADGSYLQSLSFNDNTVFTIPTDCYLFRFVTPANAGVTTYGNDISINNPSTDTTYHAYNGTTVTIAFGQTVYGGVLDVTRGKLTVMHTIIDLGSMTWTYTSGRFLSSTIDQDVKRPASNFVIADILCDSYEPDTASNTEDPSKDIIIGVSRYGVVAIRNSNYSDPDVFKTAMNGHYLVYALATPFDIDLTPEVISAIVGTNNVFANCGQTTVKYLKAGV